MGVLKNKEGDLEDATVQAKLKVIVDGVTGRVGDIKSVLELSSIIGIDSKGAQREIDMLDSIFKGEGLSHHMEGEYRNALKRLFGRDDDDDDDDAINGNNNGDDDIEEQLASGDSD